jgi:hypothetical protein
VLKKITSTMLFPTWATEGSRWRKLQIWDIILDGKLYDHVPHDFYCEHDNTGRYIPLQERRPSCQFRLPRYIARWAARKLFAGRHVPKVRCQDKDVEKKVQDLLTGTKIWPTMLEAAYRGSVGSVAISFRVEDDKIGLKVWKAQWCSPRFDDFSELTTLRVHYCTTPEELAAIGIIVSEPNRTYWFIRDYGQQQEITYEPVLYDDWNPVQGFVHDANRELVPLEVIEHGLGFVPAVWIMNPYGCGHPDGACLWEDAVPNTIEADYLMSQAARGSRYNCAPQLVTIGPTLQPPGETGTNPTTVLHFQAQHRDENGEMIGGGDAKLLEMSGNGVKAALEIVETLKKLAQEQIGIVQKDPGEMPGPLSGRAMEYLDEDAHDTAMQWRTTYGEGGALPLICKILRVLDPGLDVTKLWLQWPRIYQPTPGDLQAMVQALVMAITPITVGKPDAETGSVPTLAPLMDPEIASAYLAANLDLGILDDTEGDSPAGPSGGEPAAGKVEEDEGILGPNGPFWRIYPPIKIDMKKLR